MDGHMNTPLPATSLPAFDPLKPCTDADCNEAIRRARRVFQNTLCGWTCDLLALRRKGVNRAHWSVNATRHARPKAA